MRARLPKAIVPTAASLVALLLSVTPARSATIVVGPDDGTCPGAIFPRIQSALDAAVPGSTIVACRGVYAEQLLLAKRVRLVGAPGVRLVPGPLAVSASNLRTGRSVAAAVTVRAAATIDGLAIDAGAHGVATCDGSEPLLAAIYVDGVPARIVGTGVAGTRIPNAPPDCPNGIGILVEGYGAAPRVRLEGNTIEAYQRAGIVVQGEVRARIRENLVVGDGDTPTHAQRGIDVAPGVAARIDENVVRGHAGPSGAACEFDAAIALGAAAARLRRNHLEGNAVGVLAVTRSHTIRDNAIDGAGTGVTGLRLDADESRVAANVVLRHAAAAIRVGGNRNRLRSNFVADVHEVPECHTLRQAAGCAPALGRCGVGVWLLGQANELGATLIADVDVPLADDGSANVVR